MIKKQEKIPEGAIINQVVGGVDSNYFQALLGEELNFINHLVYDHIKDDKARQHCKDIMDTAKSIISKLVDEIRNQRDTNEHLQKVNEEHKKLNGELRKAEDKIKEIRKLLDRDKTGEKLKNDNSKINK